MASQLPGARAAIADNQGLPTPEFYRFLLGLQRLSAGSATSADIAALQTQITAIQSEIDGLPKSSFPTLQVAAPVYSQGLLQNGFAKIGVNVANSVIVNGTALQLDGDTAAPGNTYLYSTSPTGAKGWQALSGMLHQSANVAVTFGADGTATFDLAPLADAGTGTFKLLARDAYGRLAGTKDGTTSDVPEGTNLYYTDVRADARISVQKGQPNGLATLGADSKLDPGQLPALAITETFVVSTEAAMLALAAQQGDVCVRTDLHDSFILTTNDPTILANWQELETPVDGVASFNGRTGSVTPATGDYTFAQIASKPTTLSGYGITDALAKASNLSDLASTATAVTNLHNGFSRISVNLTVPQLSLGQGAFATIKFNNIVIDTLNEYSSSTGSVTVNEAGVYLVSAQVHREGMTTGCDYANSIFVNGSENKRLQEQILPTTAATGVGAGCGGACILSLNANDVITIRSFANAIYAPNDKADGIPSLNYMDIWRLL